jgi:hypothetical protein
MNYKNRIIYDGIKNNFHTNNYKKEAISLNHHVPRQGVGKGTQIEQDPSSELEKASFHQ